MRISLILFPIILLLCYVPSALDPVLVPRTLGLSVILILVLFVGLFTLKRDAEIKLNKWFVTSFVLYLLISGISVLWTVNYAEGIFELIRIPLFFGLFVFMTHLFHRDSRFIINISTGICLAALLCHYFGMEEFASLMLKDDKNSWQVGTVISLMANKNLYTSFALFSLPFSVILFRNDKVIYRGLSVVNVAISLFMFFVLQSRAIILAILVGALVVGIIWLLTGRKVTLFAKSKKLILGTVSISIIVALSILYFSPTLRSYTLDKLKYERLSMDAPETNYGSLNKRLNMFKHSIEMFKDSPIQGHGLGAWKLKVAQYGYASPEGEQGIRFSQRPHNDFLWILTETGVFGLMSYMLLFFISGLFLFRLIKYEQGEYSLIFVFGLACYIIVAFISFPKERVMHQFLLMIMFAIIHFEYVKHFPERTLLISGRIKKGIIILFICVFGFGTFVSIKRLQGEMATRELYHLYQKAKYSAMIKKAEEATSTFYNVDATSTPIDWYKGVAYFSLGKIGMAEKSFTKALEYNPNHLHVLNNIASCNELLGNREMAIVHYKKALDQSPEFAQTLCNLSAVYYNQGEIDKAYSTIFKCKITANLPETFDTYLTAIATKKLEALSKESDVDHDTIQMYLEDPEKLLLTYKRMRSHGEDFLEKLEN